MAAVAQWFYQAKGKQFGPVPSGQLKALADAGKLTADTPVKKGIDGRWVLAKQVKGIFTPLHAGKTQTADGLDADATPVKRSRRSCRGHAAGLRAERSAVGG